MSKENCREVSFEEIQKNEEINALIERGNAVLFALGYTEHSRKHAAKVAQRAGEIVRKTRHSEREEKLDRMLLCKRACEVLGYKFKLVANGSKLC